MIHPDWNEISHRVLTMEPTCLGLGVPAGAEMAVVGVVKSFADKPTSKMVRSALWAWRNKRALTRDRAMLRLLPRANGSYDLQVGAWTHPEAILRYKRAA